MALIAIPAMPLGLRARAAIGLFGALGAFGAAGARFFAAGGFFAARFLAAILVTSWLMSLYRLRGLSLGLSRLCAWWLLPWLARLWLSRLPRLRSLGRLLLLLQLLLAFQNLLGVADVEGLHKHLCELILVDIRVLLHDLL
jgi:hypothetical protein